MGEEAPNATVLVPAGSFFTFCFSLRAVSEDCILSTLASTNAEAEEEVNDDDDGAVTGIGIEWVGGECRADWRCELRGVLNLGAPVPVPAWVRVRVCVVEGA